MDEQVGVLRDCDGPLSRTGVGGVDELSPGTRRPHYLIGLDDRPVLGFDGFALVEPAELRADGHAQLLGLRAVEPAGTVVLFEDVPLRLRPVDRLERADFVAVGVERDFARGDGLDPNLKRGS